MNDDPTFGAVKAILQLAGGAGLTLFVQSLLNNKKAAEAALSDHISDVAKLREVASQFWLTTGEKDPGLVEVEVAPVHVAIASVTAFAASTSDVFGKYSIEKYNILLRDLHRTVTGGTFDSINRKPDPGRAIEIARQCALLIQFLRTNRSNIHTFERAKDRFTDKIWLPLHDSYYILGLEYGRLRYRAKRLVVDRTKTKP